MAHDWIRWHPSASFLRREALLLEVLARYFRLELRGATAQIPDWSRRPCLFVMNHTAIVGLEVYLLYAALRRLRPDAPHLRTTVWPPFLDVPLLGAWYRAGGCLPMSVPNVAGCLRAGQSVLVLPEGPDATDVRDEVGPFHAGFLRALREVAGELEVPVVPLGWAGVDEANPWWVTTHPLLVKLLMKPAMPRFDFALVPRPPLLRPSKVMFVAGEPQSYVRGDLEREEDLRAEVAELREYVIELVGEARELRESAIESDRFERIVHTLWNAHRVPWDRR